tara:strand:- start:290 stop:592 length:303 start_codon:yes stop_codon:yes gene_type:complete
MAILTNISNVPLFSTPAEAINYGNDNGLVGYHTHIYNGVTGYMAGATHGQASGSGQGSSTSNSTNTQGGSGQIGYGVGGGSNPTLDSGTGGRGDGRGERY